MHVVNLPYDHNYDNDITTTTMTSQLRQ